MKNKKLYCYTSANYASPNSKREKKLEAVPLPGLHQGSGSVPGGQAGQAGGRSTGCGQQEGPGLAQAGREEVGRQREQLALYQAHVMGRGLGREGEIYSTI